MKNSRLLAFAQLLRLPNVFTAFADIFMATAAVGILGDHFPLVFHLLIASGCLYLFGMVLNDLCDFRSDETTQSFRPLPSKRVSRRSAIIIAVGLAGFGLVSVAILPHHARELTVVAGALFLAIVLYDAVLKHYRIGPIAMGACRFLNVLLGSFAFMPDSPIPWHLACVVGLYIVGVTWFARTEEGDSRKWHLAGAAAVMALSVGLAAVVPLHLAPGRSPVYYPYLLVLFAFVVGIPLVAAIRNPTPKTVQSAVKRSIFGLVLLDAILACAFVGWPGLLIVLLLFPAIALGRWVYST